MVRVRGYYSTYKRAEPHRSCPRLPEPENIDKVRLHSTGMSHGKMIAVNDGSVSLYDHHAVEIRDIPC